MPSNKEIISYFSSKNTNSGWIDLLKVRYRPLICPFDKLLSYVNNAQSVFDIGCGSGQFCSLIAKFTSATRIHGVEIEDRLIQNARQITEEFKGSKELVFEVFDGKRLPEAISSFEIVFMIDVLHHVPPVSQESFFMEIMKMMKPGATLVMKDIDGAHPFVIFNKIHDLIFSGATGDEVSRKNARKLLEKAGFSIKEDFTQTVLLYPHYFLIAKK